MRPYMLGAAQFIQGKDILATDFDRVSKIGKTPLVIHGRHALGALTPNLDELLYRNGMVQTSYLNKGFCSRNQVAECVSICRERKLDMVLAIGGGKCMDLGKATAASLNLPIVTIPTIMATCAAVTPFSVMYDDYGRPDGAIYHDTPVDICLVDEGVLQKSPVRELKAGLIDSMAKKYELQSGGVSLSAFSPEQKSAFILADHIVNEIDDEIKKIINGLAVDLHRCIHLIISLTGACSGYAAGTKQLAVAHAFNSAFRYLHPETANNWLHGETVGVGILIQMAFNQTNKDEISEFQNKLKQMGMPYRISSFNICTDGIAERINNQMGFLKDSIEAMRITKAVNDFD